MISFSKSEVAEQCLENGPLLRVPEGIDGIRLMWAISGAESSFGANCTPRHEPAYDVGGYAYANSSDQRSLVEKYGAAAACSYGPWQVLYPNAGQWTPEELESSLAWDALAFLHFANVYVLDVKKAATVQEFAEIYNSGTLREAPSSGVLAYMNTVQNFYDNVPVLEG